MSTFVPGLTLGRRLYEEQVRPLLAEQFPDVPHSAALVGRGSEVLGLDDDTSMDHDWSARVLVFVTDEHEATRGAELADRLGSALPPTFGGHPVRPEVHSVRSWLLRELAIDIDREIRAADWLTMPEHVLRSLTAGAVFHDEVGLADARARLAYYPRDVWLYLLITGWWRIHPEANLVGRSGAVGDELGSSLIGSRLAKDLMRLGFLVEREYAPYAKWFGTAFTRLPCGAALTPLLLDVVHARTWQDREDALLRATSALLEVYDRLHLTEPVPIEVVRLWDRPFRVAWADVPELLYDQIEDPEVLRLVDTWPVGPVDQLRELTWAPRHRPALLKMFGTPEPGAPQGR